MIIYPHNMHYAVVRINGHQYKVSEGEEFLVDKTANLDGVEVLLVVNDTKVEIGSPLVKGAKVELTKLGDEKGEKIDVFKYKAKSRYRKKRGFRHSLSRIKVEKITV